MAERVLIVDGDRDARAALDDVLRQVGYEVTAAGSGAEALALFAVAEFDVVLADVSTPGIGGIELCERITGDRPDVPVVLMAGVDDADVAVAALRAGATDFVSRPCGSTEIVASIETSLNGRRPSAAISLLPARAQQVAAIPELIGDGPAMRSTVDRIVHLAATDGTVLVTGESGTGKELVARALHAHGPRARAPFVAVSCAALPAELLESELFGHERGAFTGAVSRHEGLFVQADGGTIFLDEIGAMPIELQPKLLRALESRAVRSVGGTHEIHFDARVVAATNIDLEQAVRAGTFRRDLLFRIDVLSIHVPPLRERRDDIIKLAEHFIHVYATGDPPKLSPEVKDRFLSYAWPGNVRELENCVQACVAVGDTARIGFEELPTAVRTSSAALLFRGPTLSELERRHIETALEAVQGNKAAAARTLGIDRTTLYRKLRRLGMASRDR